MKKRITCLFTGLLAFVLGGSPPALAVSQELFLKMVANGEIKSVLVVEGRNFSLKGRTSIYLEATEKELNQGKIRVRGINIACFQVPQAVLTHEKIAADRKGVLGFALSPAEGTQYAAYQAKDGVLTAKLSGYMDADFMADAAGLPYKGDDIVDTPKQKATITFQIMLNEPLVFKDTGDKVMRQTGKVAIRLNADEDLVSDAKAYQMALEYALIDIESTIFRYYEVAKRIKIQPVRIGKCKFLYPPGIIQCFYTGAGLDFGLPQVNEQWKKADVIFSINDWVTVWDTSFWLFDDTEATELKNQVTIDDAVEVFFVNNFSPECLWGGGATWGLGSAGSKIITSDANARWGIDFTHLAHELGHAIGLDHPDGRPGVSTGTLMCPSGCRNDNPQINSQENKDNVTNPLFTFMLKLVTDGPDCTDSADCGACP